VAGFPTPKEVSAYLKDVAELRSIKEVILPAEIVPAKMRPLYKLAVKIKIVKIIPESWLAIYAKK
jgi:hypothetical protein